MGPTEEPTEEPTDACDGNTCDTDDGAECVAKPDDDGFPLGYGCKCPQSHYSKNGDDTLYDENTWFGPDDDTDHKCKKRCNDGAYNDCDTTNGECVDEDLDNTYTYGYKCTCKAGYLPTEWAPPKTAGDACTEE